MTRWSLSNRFLPISRGQFLTLTAQFQKAAEESFGGSCALNIRALYSPKRFTTFMDDDLQADLDKRNADNTILETSSLSDVGKEIWAKAGYVEVTLSPANPQAAPQYAFAHMEFKGRQPRQASYYIQPDGEDVKQTTIAQNRTKRIGDGMDSNGIRSGSIFAGFHIR